MRRTKRNWTVSVTSWESVAKKRKGRHLRGSDQELESLRMRVKELERVTKELVKPMRSEKEWMRRLECDSEQENRWERERMMLMVIELVIELRKGKEMWLERTKGIEKRKGFWRETGKKW
jgi:hypothetical protein